MITIMRMMMTICHVVVSTLWDQGLTSLRCVFGYAACADGFLDFMLQRPSRCSSALDLTVRLRMQLQARWERGAEKSQGLGAAQLGGADPDPDPNAYPDADLVERFDRFEGPEAPSSNGSQGMDGAHDVLSTKAESSEPNLGASTKRNELSGTKGRGDSPVSPTDSPGENGQAAVVGEPTPGHGEDAPGDGARELGVNGPEASRIGSWEQLGSREPPPSSGQGSRGEGATSIGGSASAAASDGNDRGPRHEKRSSAAAADSRDAVDAAESFIKNLGIVDEFDEVRFVSFWTW